MGRAKLNMELIPKEKSRNSTFVKRKKGLKKKTFEFSTLCGVDTCMIIYGPKQPGQGDRPIEPETYPNNLAEVHRIINRYRDVTRDERGVGGKRNNNLFDFFEERKKKMDEELVKLRKKNDQSELDMWDEWTKDFNVEELKEFMRKLESGIEKMDARIELIKAGGKQSGVGGLIEYSSDTGNQNIFIQSLCSLPPLSLPQQPSTTTPPPTTTTTTTTATSTFHGCRDNDMVFQSQPQPQTQFFGVKSSPFNHCHFQFDNQLVNWDNSSSMSMVTNNSYDMFGIGAVGNYSTPTMIPTPFKNNNNNNMPLLHDPYYPPMGISYDSFDAESFRMPSMGIGGGGGGGGGGGYNTGQLNTSHLQHILHGSSSATPQTMIHHSNHYQPSNELFESMNKYNKKSRFD